MRWISLVRKVSVIALHDWQGMGTDGGFVDDHEIYEALRRVHLLDESVGAEELKDNPFANLDSFVALGTYISVTLKTSLRMAQD